MPKPPQALAADLARTALPTRVLPSFHTAPVVRCAAAMTASNDCSIHAQSSSEMVSVGNSLIVSLPCPATCVSSLWPLNSGITISWEKSPLLAVSNRFQDAPSHVLAEGGTPSPNMRRGVLPWYWAAQRQKYRDEPLHNCTPPITVTM